MEAQLAARIGAGGGGGATDGDSFKPVVQRLYGFVMSRVQYALDDWFEANVDTFAGDDGDDASGAGFRHEYAELHRQYEERMEELLDEFCSSEGMDLSEFMEKCSQVRRRASQIIRRTPAERTGGVRPLTTLTRHSPSQRRLTRSTRRTRR